MVGERSLRALARHGRVRASLLLLLALSVISGCSASDAGGGGSGFGTAPFGAPCVETEDCASGICVRVNANRGVCSRVCGANEECPASPNWGCVDAENASAKVCACVPDSTEEMCGDGADNECNGLVDDCQLCNGKPVPKDDPANCGACGKYCRSDQMCSLGQCSCPPSTPFECAGACVDLDVDDQNCGNCGVACEPGQTCESGVCVCDDPSADDYCPGSGCIDLETDPKHCGNCATVCADGLICTDGACQCPTSALPDHCDGVGCVDFASDEANCGGCGKHCPTSATCNSGKCECPFNAPETCGSTCVDLSSDPMNCGTCGKSCPSGLSCSGGACACPAGTPNLCNGQCVDTSTNTQNCGTCNNVCPADKACSNGSCICPLSLPNLCGTKCTNLSSDEQNCGICGTVCPSGQTCQSGLCKCPSLGQTSCNGICVFLSTNASHCGACGNACPSGQTCSGGACKCPTSGFSPCGANCVNLSADPNNCGACGNVCPAAQSCVSGTCACPSGQTYCAALGQCINTKTDPSHCGSCGNACQPGEICSNGTCTCSSSTEDWCASTGTCTPIYSNSNHCGACDKVCPAGTQCSGWSCVCSQAGYTLCGGTACYDLKSDPDHCGSCTNACSGNHACIAGKCDCPPAIIGSEVRLTTTLEEETYPVIAWGGTHAAVAYLQAKYLANGSFQSRNLYLAILNPDGTRAITPDVAITNLASGSVGQPDIVWNGSEYAVVWTHGSNLWFQRFTATGVAKAAAINITATTPGSTVITWDKALIEWSDVYGGYALASRGGGSILFQRIGSDGTAPEPVNAKQFLQPGANYGFASSPTGEWAIGTSSSFNALLVVYNPDGSQTKPPLSFAADLPWVDLVHDGTTWSMAFAGASGNSLRLNRGETSNQYTVVTGTSSNPSVSMTSAGVLALKWKDTLYRLRRYNVPPGTSNAYTQLGTTTTLVSASTASELVVEPTGSDSMLAVWSDTRWGTPELYAVAVDFQGCP